MRPGPTRPRPRGRTTTMSASSRRTATWRGARRCGLARSEESIMELKINPHELILIGENSFVRLTTDNGKSASTRCSHWRVLWSPAGPGHALFVDSGLVQGVRIYADSVPLARFLQKEIEYLLHKPFGDLGTAV